MSRTDNDRPEWAPPLGVPPRWYVHARWWGPQRALERGRSRKMVIDYKTYGDVDDDLIPHPGQHRHGAYWTWW